MMRGIGTRETPKRRWIVAIAGLAAGALMIAPGAAGAKQRVVVKPRPGQEVRTHPVRIVVRAGPEYGDLSARLNGRQVGEDFERRPLNRRVLLASNSHGLRHGESVLRVNAWRNGKLRRATVRFTVAHTRPMAGAGRDLTIPAGTRLELNGDVRKHPTHDFGGQVRWRVAKAPRGSALRARHHRSQAAARSAQRRALRAPKTLTPAFKPDVLGTYKLEIQAHGASRATTDRLTVSAVPEQPLVPISTAVPPDGSDPRWGIKLSCPDPCGDPDIAEDVFRAPWMRKTGAAGGSTYSGTSDGRHYEALWQVVSLERTTLKLLWNRTYGWCTPGPPTTPYGGFCRRGENGEPVFIDAAKELTENGPDGQPPLIIASSHPSLTSMPNGSGNWGQPDTNGFVSSDPLPRLGSPDTNDSSPDPDAVRFTAEIRAAKPGWASFIGVPGMDSGEAQWAIRGDNSGINGALTPDQNANFGFVAQARAEFNTRSAMGSCPGHCYVSQQIGDQTHSSENEADGFGGYLVTANDPSTLGFVDSHYFRTQAPPGATGVSAMTSYLKQLQADGSLITITSLGTPGMGQQFGFVSVGAKPSDWDALADQVVALGGTRHRFNLAAVTPGDDYTLLGWAGANEGDGVEAIGPNATVQGTLVPDEQYRFRPIDTAEDGTDPPSRLANLLLQPPSSNWPEYPQDPAGGNAALKWLAAQFPTQFGTADPRVAYWAAPIHVHDADTIRGDLTKSYNQPTDYPPGHGFSPDDFKWAVDELYKELGWVDTARTYMTGAEDDHGVQTSGGLALPTFAAGQKAWQEANDAGTQLVGDLKNLKQKAETQANYFDVVEGILDVVLAAAGLPGSKKLEEGIEAFAEASAGLIEEAGVLYEKNWDGGSAADEIAVEVDQLGDQLQTRLQSTTATFSQMANIVVSDPVKLAEVGTWGGCKASVGGCGLTDLDTGEQEFEEYSDPEGTKEELQTMVDTVNRGVERTIWEELVPLAFPVWDIAAYPQSGNTAPTTAAPSEDAIDLNQFSCNRGFGTQFNNPFDGAPRAAWTGSLEHVNAPGLPLQWRVRISAGKSGYETYSWLTPDQLDKMLGSPSSGGLGIDPHDWMRDATPVYAPASDVFCGWLR